MHTHTHTHSFRIIAGAPRGSYPGGLNLIDEGNSVPETGLVYQCPVNPGICGGVLGELRQPINSGNNSSFQPLFDESRKFENQ